MGPTQLSLRALPIAILAASFASLCIAADVPNQEPESSDAAPIALQQGELDAAQELPPRPKYDDWFGTKGPPDPCTEPVEAAAAGWLDKTNSLVYQTVCGSVAWFDGFFGSKEYDLASSETFGRVGLSTFWDERDGFDNKFRLRARYALPHLRERTSLIIGRGDSRQEVTEEKDSQVDTVPGSFNSVEDDSFLVGLGYSRNQGLKRGLDFGIGAKVRIPPEPYVKTSYRQAWQLDDVSLLRVRPIVYWRSDEGFGSTLNVSIDRLLTQHLMLRWANSGNISEDEDVEGVEWITGLSLFQDLNDRRAINYRVMLHGETKSDVPIRNYGFEVRYRRRMLRKWLFVELLSSLTWPKDFVWEKREPNIGVGVGLEMYFGPVPDAQLR
jgi:hypothetical protein